MSPGEQLIDLVYVDDVIQACLLSAKWLMENKVSSMEEYAISSGNPISLKELIAVYGQTIGKPLSIEWGRRSYRAREVMMPWNTWNKGKRLSGWKPKIGLAEGIKRMERIKEYLKAGRD